MLRRHRYPRPGTTVAVLLVLLLASMLLLQACAGGSSSPTPAASSSSVAGTTATSASSAVASIASSAGATTSASAAASGNLAAQGQQLASHYGCLNCHTTNGSKGVGPTWKGLSSSQVKMANGQSVTADDAYLKKCITDPASVQVEGYPQGVMGPAIQQYASDIKADDHLNALVAYIDSLK